MREALSSGVVCGYHMKVFHIRHNLFAKADILSLSVHEPITMRVLWGRPPFGRVVELGGRVWYSVKDLHITHHLFAGADTLSFPV